MGWTSQHATHYKWLGKGIDRKYVVDRKAECDAYFEEGLNRGHFKVLKSTMVGSVYYGAIKRLVKYAGNNEKGERIYVPRSENEKSIFAAVFLTSTDAKDYYNFSYKEMDETSGPYSYECPKSILDLLSPTDNDYAKVWRIKCYERIEEKKQEKKNPDSLNNLPEGTIIQVVMPFETYRYKKGDVVQLIKKRWSKSKKWFVNNTNVYFTKQTMALLKKDFEIIRRGEEL